MYVGIAKLTVVVVGSHSLKEKRMVIRRIKDRVRDRIGIVLSEVGELESWQRAELGCAVTSGDRQKALQLLDEVVRVAQAAAEGHGEIVGVAKDAITFDGQAVAVSPIGAGLDDRTGAGDKAVAGDDWVPAAWRDDLDE